LLKYLPFSQLAFTVDARATLSLDGQLVVITGCARTDTTALLVTVNQAASGGRAKGLWRRLSGDPGWSWVAILPVFSQRSLQPGSADVNAFDPFHGLAHTTRVDLVALGV
jgi:hypothetical protein